MHDQQGKIIGVVGNSRDITEYRKAEEALRLAQISYDFGEGTNLEVFDAQVSLSQIKQNYSSAIYDYLMAKAFLDRTMGKGIFPLVAEGGG